MAAGEVGETDKIVGTGKLGLVFRWQLMFPGDRVVSRAAMGPSQRAPTRRAASGRSDTGRATRVPRVCLPGDVSVATVSRVSGSTLLQCQGAVAHGAPAQALLCRGLLRASQDRWGVPAHRWGGGRPGGRRAPHPTTGE